MELLRNTALQNSQQQDLPETTWNANLKQQLGKYEKYKNLDIRLNFC